MQTVCDVGVDFNRVKRCPSLHPLVQFLPGMGPRRAKLLLDALPPNGRVFPDRDDILDTVKELFVPGI